MNNTEIVVCIVDGILDGSFVRCPTLITSAHSQTDQVQVRKILISPVQIVPHQYKKHKDIDNWGYVVL